MKEDFVH